MRVAIYVHCYFPEHYFGTEAYARLLARELREAGHEPVIVAATFAGEPAQARFVERYEVDGIPVYRIDKNACPPGDLGETYLQPAMRERHTALLAEIAPDVVHVCHLINHTASLLEATDRLGIPTFATFTDFFGLCFNSKLQAADGTPCAGPNRARSNCIACLLKDLPTSENRLHRLARAPALRPAAARALAAMPALAGKDAAVIRSLKARPAVLSRAYRSFRAAIAPTRYLLDAYRRNGCQVPLTLSHFGVDIDRAPKPARHGPGIRLGYIGQLAPHKGVHVLLDALHALGADAFSLSIYGSPAQDPAYVDDLRARAAGLPVRFEGTFAADEIATVLAGIDLLVIPSVWSENSPLVLLQALATHTPVLVSDVPGLTELVREGESGFSFPAGEAGGLARVLRRFIADPELAARMSRRTRYERTPREMAGDVLALYDEHVREVRA
jgi:glycosyltransferase involved in cell wall biosynthesis